MTRTMQSGNCSAPESTCFKAPTCDDAASVMSAAMQLRALFPLTPALSSKGGEGVSGRGLVGGVKMRPPRVFWHNSRWQCTGDPCTIGPQMTGYNDECRYTADQRV